MRFSKMHGAGNDFVVLDLRGGRPAPAPDLCAHLADRQVGVGCDQILTIEPPRSAAAVASYRIWNADGSASGQCGNGARCIAAWLVRDGSAPRRGAFCIDSPTGTHPVQHDDDGFVIDMGRPQFEPAAIPLAGVASAQASYTLDIDGRPLDFGAVSMGNPHAVIEVEDVRRIDLERLGPLLQANASFPQSCNVGVAQVMAPDCIRLRVYERGVGETLACGSGACAAVAVLAQRGRVDAEGGVAVKLPGGTLHVRIDADSGSIYMGGPTAFVFEGEWL